MSTSGTSANALIQLGNKLNRLLETVHDDPLELPRVAVVGSQSVGKSSVLEAFVGRDFLPRGSDIVTRRPLVLELVNTSSTSTDEPNEWGEFKHVPGQKFFDFAQIRREIEDETIRKCGTSKNISPDPMYLTIYSPNVLTLTLIDLPGLTKIAVGDQPTDISVQIHSLVSEYVSNPSTIILAVSAANVDIANSESLQLAKVFDPYGERTLGVVTKLDLMDRGTDAANLLSGKLVNLKLGFIGVVNRSQHDTRSGKSIKAAFEAEETFFRSHPSYGRLLNRCGTSNLAKELHSLLSASIRQRIPAIRKKLSILVSQAEQDVSMYGEQLLSKSQQFSMLLQQILAFTTNYKGLIEGHAIVATNELVGGSRISFIFNDIFLATLSKADPCAGLTTQEIRTALRNSAGARDVLFVPESAFELLIKRQISRLLDPSMQCMQRVADELTNIALRAEPKELQRFPVLRQHLIQSVSVLQKELMGPTKHMVESLVKIELAHINMRHPDFATTAAAFQAAERVQSRKPEGKGASNGNGSSSSGGDNPALTAANNQPKQNRVDGNGNNGLFWMFFGGANSQTNGGSGKKSNDDSGRSSSAANGNGASSEDDAYVGLSQQETKISNSDQMNDRELMEIELLRALIISYFSIVRRTIQDSVPKSIMCFLVNEMMLHLQERLTIDLVHEDKCSELLSEDASIVSERKKAKERFEIFTAASVLVNELINEGGLNL